MHFQIYFFIRRSFAFVIACSSLMQDLCSKVQTNTKMDFSAKTRRINKVIVECFSLLFLKNIFLMVFFQIFPVTNKKCNINFYALHIWKIIPQPKMTYQKTSRRNKQQQKKVILNNHIYDL